MEVAKTATLEYEPLDPTRRRAIRLIRLLPQRDDEWDTVIDCQVFHADLDKNPDYQALSYVWGSESKPFNLRIDGQALAVTTNLFEALIYLRKPYPRTLWIDAVCINQNDIAERNRQVQMMQLIFARATRTVIWLGSLHILRVNDHDDLALSISRGGPPSMNGGESQRQMNDNLRKFLASPWFRRIWIVQELACSVDPYIQIGRSVIDWSTLENLLSKDPSVQNISGGTSFEALCRYREAWRGGQKSTVLDLVMDLSTSEATDSRDRIFALLSLSDLHNNGSVPLKIDYELSMTEVLLRVANNHLDCTGNIDFLACGRSFDQKQPLSWFPFGETKGQKDYETIKFLRSSRWEFPGIDRPRPYIELATRHLIVEGYFALGHPNVSSIIDQVDAYEHLPIWSGASSPIALIAHFPFCIILKEISKYKVRNDYPDVYHVVAVISDDQQSRGIRAAETCTMWSQLMTERPASLRRIALE